MNDNRKLGVAHRAVGQGRFWELLTGVILLAPTLCFTALFLIVPLLFTFSLALWTRNPGFPFPDNFRDFLGDFAAAFMLLGCIVGAAAGAWALLRDNSERPAWPAWSIGLGIAIAVLVAAILWRAHAVTSVLPPDAAIIGSTLLAAGIIVAVAGMRYARWRAWPLRLSGFITVVGCVVISGQAVRHMRDAVKAFSYDPTQDVLSNFHNTFLFATLSVTIQIMLGLVMAYAIYRPLPGRSLYRIAIILPFLAPAVAMAVVFNAIFNPNDAGLINQLLRFAGLPMQGWAHSELPVLSWLPFAGGYADLGPSLSVMTLVLFNVWCFAGYTAMLLLAGTATIPRTIYEAAALDGATRWGMFRDITVPLLTPVLLFLAVTSWIGAAQSFNHSYILVEGAKNAKILTAPIEIYRLRRDIEVASAIAVLLFVLIGVVSVLQLILWRKRVHYGE